MTQKLYENVFLYLGFLMFNCNVRVVLADKAQPIIIACQDQALLLGSDRNMAKAVGVLIGLTLHLQCGFCENSDDFKPKIWYVKKRGENINTTTEVEIGMENNEYKNKITLTPSHVLMIANFTPEDCGIYTCKRLHLEDDNVFTYAVDGVFSEDVHPKFGKIHNWNEYKRNYLDSLNEKLEKGSMEPFSDLRIFNFTFRVMTSWEPWGRCELYGRRKGVRRKLGMCRLHCKPFTSFTNNTRRQVTLPNATVNYYNILKYYLVDDYDVPCRSIKFNETFPRLSEILRMIPEFELREPCDDFVSDSTQGQDGYKHKVVKHVAEKGHMILVCPETTLESTVEWYKDKKLLNDTFRNNMAEKEEPHITIDAYNSMYILHATKKEEGIYSCTVDGRKIQKFDVRIVSQSKILNEEFIRYSIYLGFVLSMTITCFCAGLCVAWHRRSSFADPLNLKDKFNKKAEERQILRK